MSNIYRELCSGINLSLEKNKISNPNEIVKKIKSESSNNNNSSLTNVTDHAKLTDSVDLFDDFPPQSYLETHRISVFDENKKEVPIQWPLITKFSHLNDLVVSLRDFKNNSENKRCKGAPRWLVDNIKRNMKLSTATPIQQITIPTALLGHNILGISPTGSGKTISYLIPLLVKLQNSQKLAIRSLIIAHTRELAIQIDKTLLLLTENSGIKHLILKKKDKEISKLDICIATPLTLLKLINEKKVNLDKCKTLIIDEADKLFEYDFEDQINEILSYLPKENIQKLLFSATINKKTRNKFETIMPNYYKVLIGKENAACSDIVQELICVTNEAGKLSTFRQMFSEGKLTPPILVFIDSKKKVDRVFRNLIHHGMQVAKLSSKFGIKERDFTVNSLRTGMIWVLLCTDLLARGVDFPQVSCVVNFDPPRRSHVYIHRIGRTGRAGRKGRAITFYTLEDIPKLKVLAKVMRLSECKVPDFMLELEKSGNKKRTLSTI